MKKNCYFLILVFASCSVFKSSNSEKDKPYSEHLIREFKTVFFMDCLTSEGVCSIESLKNDRSTSSDFELGLANYKLIDSLVDVVTNKIHLDSIEWTNYICKECDEELLKRLNNDGVVGKRIFRFCLDYYTSTELDSIAKANILQN